MKVVPIPLPEPLLAQLAHTRLAGRPAEQQVRIALALFLYEHDHISFGKAAELAGEPRIDFELFAAELGSSTVKYDEEMYAEDQRAHQFAHEQAARQAEA